MCIRDRSSPVVVAFRLGAFVSRGKIVVLSSSREGFGGSEPVTAGLAAGSLVSAVVVVACLDVAPSGRCASLIAVESGPQVDLAASWPGKVIP